LDSDGKSIRKSRKMTERMELTTVSNRELIFFITADFQGWTIKAL